MTNGLPGRRFWRRAVDRLRERMRVRSALAEMASLDPGERARVLAETGLSWSEFRRVMLLPLALEDLLSRAMRSIGIDPERFKSRHPEWFRALRHTCATCAVRRHCGKVMARSEFAWMHQRFCPNSGSFLEIALAENCGVIAPHGPAWHDPFLHKATPDTTRPGDVH